MHYFNNYKFFKTLQIIILELLFILNISIINYYINQVLYDKFSNYISIYTGFPINYSFLFLLICLEIYVCFKIKTL